MNHVDVLNAARRVEAICTGNNVYDISRRVGPWPDPADVADALRGMPESTVAIRLTADQLEHLQRQTGERLTMIFGFEIWT